LQLTPPPSLRAVIIGGGALHDSLYERAIQMGWRLLPNYGMTECCSQVATSSLVEAGSPHKPHLKPLSHVQVLVEAEILQIKSPALLTCYLFKKAGKYEVVDPKVDGWFSTEDRASYSDGILQIYGRDSSFVKIGGESCDLLRLERILEEVKLERTFSQD